MGKVYLEPVFAVNTVMNMLTLYIAGRLAGERARLWRYCLASSMGGLYAAAMLLPFCDVLNNLLAKAVLSCAMALLSWRPRGWLPYLRGWAAMVGVTVVGGGAALAASVLMDSARPLGGAILLSKNALLLTILGAAAMALLSSRALQRRGRGGSHYTVRAWCGGRLLRLDALLDTGNMLCEPVSGLPVMIIDVDMGKKLIGNMSDRTIEIPFKTVGGLSSMKAVLADRTEVRSQGRWRDAGAMYVAASTNWLSGGVEALLPPAALE
jgi:stage II sporulation protein GA (sporulation sigma-E factor processing peptidase)